MAMTYYAVTDDPNELAHWGIKGMKWGVRHDKPRHPGSSRPRSIAYKKAQNKLGQMMKSGIKKAEAHWKTYNSPAAKEERFMKKAMQQARTGTLKYGKLTDDQVRKVADRLALERNARSLGSTENPKFGKRLKTAIGTGIVTGVGAGTTAYIEERMRGRGRTTAEIKADKRRAKYEGRDDVQRRRALNKQTEEFYKTAYEEGDNPYHFGLSTSGQRAKYLSAVKKRNKENDYKANIQKTHDEQYARMRANNDAKLDDDLQRGIRVHRDERKISPTKVSYLDPGTGKKKMGSRWEALDAYNRAHENFDQIADERMKRLSSIKYRKSGTLKRFADYSSNDRRLSNMAEKHRIDYEERRRQAQIRAMQKVRAQYNSRKGRS